MKKEMNKGFSLVELIIVIAIMAVLVGLLAPQYLRFVNNSKVSTDISNGQELATAFNVAFADGKIGVSTFTGTGGNTLTVSGVSSKNWPQGKYAPAACPWSVQTDDNGVKEVKCNNVIVWPDASAYEAFKK